MKRIMKLTFRRCWCKRSLSCDLYYGTKTTKSLIYQHPKRTKEPWFKSKIQQVYCLCTWYIYKTFKYSYNLKYIYIYNRCQFFYHRKNVKVSQGIHVLKCSLYTSWKKFISISEYNTIFIEQSIDKIHIKKNIFRFWFCKLLR